VGPVNSNKSFVPVALTCAGISAAPLGARPSLGVLATSRTADIREMAPARAAAGVRMPWLGQGSASVQPRPGQGPASAKPRLGFAQRKQNNPTQTYAHAIGAVATGDSRTGSQPAWDPV
jgi:hypothetical protein